MKRTEADQNKKWVDFLNRQIDIELEKPENEQSMEFIDECSSLIDEVRGEADNPDPKIKERRLTELYSAFEKQAANKRRRPVFHIWKKIAAAACILLAIIATPVFVAAAVNKISPIAVLERWGKAIFDMPYDTPVEESGMTFIRNSNLTYYESPKELLEAEKLDIMYLGWLPDGVELTEIIKVGESEGTSLIFNYSGEEIYYTAALYDKYGETISDDFTNDIVEINGILYYLSVLEEKNNAVFVKDGYSYSVTAGDRDTLIKLLKGINSIKESRNA